MVDITIVNQGRELARVAESLNQLAAERNLAPDTVADMQVALDEVLTNILKYARTDNAEHEIHICLQVRDNVLEVTIDDGGAPFDPLAVPAPDLNAPLRERRVGGVGIHFVRNLVDELTYDRIGERNLLVLRKRFRT